MGVRDAKVTNKNQTSIQALISLLIPIKKKELLQFCLIALLLFFILFIQNILKALKDTLVSTLIATEVITILKTWFVLPIALIFVVIYTKLINVLKLKNVFYLIVSCFGIFFAIFAFYLFPSQYTDKYIQCNADLAEQFIYFKWIILICKNWGCCLFYVIAELWQNIVYALLFWQLMNFIHSVEQSKRFYIFFGFFGQTSLILTGIILGNINSLVNAAYSICPTSNLNKQILSVQILSIMIIALIALIHIAFFLINKYIVAKCMNVIPTIPNLNNKLSLKDSLFIVAKSKSIRLLMLLLISYGISTSSIEPLFREKIKQAYPTALENLEFTGKIIFYTGLLTVTCTTLGSIITRRCKWIVGAMIPSISTLIFGCVFFFCCIFTNTLKSISLLWAIKTSLITVVAGALHSIFAKSTKYTFFDATKEMFYVPMSPEDKIQGKACADILGSKVGKSITSCILQFILFTIPSATFDSMPLIFMSIFFTACAIWIITTIRMGKIYNYATGKK